jgi:tetratricopeptide (TPR) repeat protein
MRGLIMVKIAALFLACLFTPLVTVSCATKSSAVRKQKADVYRRVGEGHLRGNNATAALAELLKAKKIYDKDPVLHYDMGLVYFVKEEFDLAIAHFNKAVALKSDAVYSDALNAKGRVYLRLKQWDKAIACFNQALDNLLYATPHLALSNLGEAYRGKKDYGHAIEAYDKALQKSPVFPNAYRGLGLVYMDMGNYEAAVTSLEKAVRYAPNFARAYYDLGLAYVGQYHLQSAVSAFKKVVELAPDSPLADRALAEIRKLQG